MLPLSAHSRRALAATAGLLAAAPVAAAKKKKKRKKKEKPAPLVLAIATIFEFALEGADQDLEYLTEAVYEYLPTGGRFGFGGANSIPFPAAGDDPRAQLVLVLQETIAGRLADDIDVVVPVDRIAVTLL